MFLYRRPAWGECISAKVLWGAAWDLAGDIYTFLKLDTCIALQNSTPASWFRGRGRGQGCALGSAGFASKLGPPREVKGKDP